MIVFSVAFGESYVNSLFVTSLPSFMRGSKITEPIHLIVYTTQNDIPLVKNHFSQIPKWFQSIRVVGLTNGPIDRREIGYKLLQSALSQCVLSNEIFACAVPDLIYGAGTLENCYHAHILTGRVVAMFNGRVQPTDNTPSLLKAAESSQLLQKYFLDNCDDMWKSHTTTNIREIVGSVPGHMIYKGERQTLLFGSCPNPTLGRFTDMDQHIITRGMPSWDHEWADYLDKTNRLLVMTDLNSAMSIEPSNKVFIPKALKSRIPNMALRRDHKFTTAKLYMFTANASATP